MGRFYKTTSDTPIDYMDRMNTPLMEKVLLSNDAGIDKSLTQTNADNSAINFNYLPQDADSAKKLQDQLHSQVSDVSNAIQGDYANWKKQINPLRQLGQSLKDQYATGDISKFQGNYNQMKADFAEADKQGELWHKSGGTKGADPLAVALWKNKSLNSFKGTKNPDGTYGTFSSTPLSDTIDINKVIDDTMKNVVKDSTTKEFTDFKNKGAYFDDVSQSWKGIPQNKILSVAMDRIKSDPRIMDNLRQYQSIGYISGAMNPDNTIKSPFSTTPNNKLSPDEQSEINTQQQKINILKRTNPEQAKAAQAILDKQSDVSSRTSLQWDNSSYLTPYLRGALERYSGVEQSTKEKLRNNSLFNLGVSESGQDRRALLTQTGENQRLIDKQKHDIVMAGINYDNKIGEMSKAAELKANSIKKITGDGLSKPTILAAPTSTPYGFLGTDANTIAKSMNNKIQQNQGDLDVLYDEKKKAQNEGRNEDVNFISNQIATKLSDQMTLGARDQKAHDDAYNSVVPEVDRDIYANRDLIKQEHAEAQQRKLTESLLTESGKPRLNDPFSETNMNLAKKDQETEANYKKAIKYEKDENTQYKNNLLKATKETTNGATEVGTTTDNNNFIKSAITADPSTFKILDINSGAEIANFQDGKLDVEDKKFKIVGAGPSSGAGAKTMNIYANIAGKNVLIVPTGKSADIVKEHLMSDWNRSGDEGVKALTKTWSSPYYKAVNDATTDIIQNDNTSTGLGATHHGEIGLPNGQAQIAITKVGTSGWKVEIEGDKGWKQLPNPNGGGYFTTDADIVDALNRTDAVIRQKMEEAVKKK